MRVEWYDLSREASTLLTDSGDFIQKLKLGILINTEVKEIPICVNRLILFVVIIRSKITLQCICISLVCINRQYMGIGLLIWTRNIIRHKPCINKTRLPPDTRLLCSSHVHQKTWPLKFSSLYDQQKVWIVNRLKPLKTVLLLFVTNNKYNERNSLTSSKDV